MTARRNAIGDPDNPEQDLLMAERELAVVSFQNGYAGLIEAMRNRAAARRIAISSENFAQLCGLPSYYAVKLLSVNPVRRIGAL
ncbi:MAG: hypothetical protein WBG18_27640, partial [Xanthobacteraceae bacterium]